MRKAMGFRINEKKGIKELTVGNGIHDYPYFRQIPFMVRDNFDSNELGNIFIKMGYELKKVGKDITNIELKSKFVDNLEDIGKTFMVELQFEEVEK